MSILCKLGIHRKKKDYTFKCMSRMSKGMTLYDFTVKCDKCGKLFNRQTVIRNKHDI